ncbi:MAG: hypothetical protein KH230_13615 [Enterocloster asparagiformis]|nr:hypothetical protein [Enterocloster asparagiformis]
MDGIVKEFKGIEIESISISVYLGEKYIANDFKTNQKIFENEVKNKKISNSFAYECPFEDLVCVYPDDMDNLEIIANELNEIFGGNVKINLYLNGFIDGKVNSIDIPLEFLYFWRLYE